MVREAHRRLRYVSSHYVPNQVYAEPFSFAALHAQQGNTVRGTSVPGGLKKLPQLRAATETGLHMLNAYEKCVNPRVGGKRLPSDIDWSRDVFYQSIDIFQRGAYTLR